MSNLPKISFGMIVLNGEPFTRYNLRALYPFAHQIIVVEGACLAARYNATEQGHSIDGTLEILNRFKAEEDPDDKLVIVTAEDEGYPDGFWPGEKDEQSRAYALRATGDWLWQVDSDEFYMPQDMQWLCENYLSLPDVWVISFKQIQFWGGLKSYADGWFLRHYFSDIYRIFRWSPDFSYATHRPPTILDGNGNNIRNLGWVKGRLLVKRDIYMYHYSLVFPFQVQSKSRYYSEVDWGAFEKMSSWANENYDKLNNPYRVHNSYQYPSWLEHYNGDHPPQILQMWDDIRNNRFVPPINLRKTDDIDRILRSKRYILGKNLLKTIGPIVYHARIVTKRLIKYLPMKAQLNVVKTLRNISYRIIS